MVNLLSLCFRIVETFCLYFLVDLLIIYLSTDLFRCLFLVFYTLSIAFYNFFGLTLTKSLTGKTGVS